MASPDVSCHSPGQQEEMTMWQGSGTGGMGFHPSQNISPVNGREQVPLLMAVVCCLLGVIFFTVHT